MAVTFPRTDEGLLAWSVNFSTKITATPTAFGLTAAQATAYAAVHTAYSTALAACDPSLRNKTATAAKNTAKAALKLAARQMGSIVEGTPTVTDAQKISLGLNVRRTPVPIPAPSSSPGLDIVAVAGWTVNIHLHDTASSAKRGKPPGVIGAAVFSYVGALPPADIGAWQFEGNTGGRSLTWCSPTPWLRGRKCG